MMIIYQNNQILIDFERKLVLIPCCFFVISVLVVF
jgi:hypothetical protein